MLAHVNLFLLCLFLRRLLFSGGDQHVGDIGDERQHKDQCLQAGDGVIQKEEEKEQKNNHHHRHIQLEQLPLHRQRVDQCRDAQDDTHIEEIGSQHVSHREGSLTVEGCLHAHQ